MCMYHFLTPLKYQVLYTLYNLYSKLSLRYIYIYIYIFANLHECLKLSCYYHREKLVSYFFFLVGSTWYQCACAFDMLMKLHDIFIQYVYISHPIRE